MRKATMNYRPSATNVQHISALDSPACCGECIHWVESNRRLDWGFNHEIRFCPLVGTWKFEHNAARDECWKLNQTSFNEERV